MKARGHILWIAPFPEKWFLTMQAIKLDHSRTGQRRCAPHWANVRQTGVFLVELDQKVLAHNKADRSSC